MNGFELFVLIMFASVTGLCVATFFSQRATMRLLVMARRQLNAIENSIKQTRPRLP